MFANSITVVTALTMLAHSVWGCCWHHAHDGHGAQACTASHVESADHQEHHHCSHAAEHPTGASSASQTETSDDGHQEDHQHLPCHEAQCTYVVTAPVSIDGFWAAMVAVFPEVTDVIEQPLMAASRWDVDSTRPPRDAHAVRALTQTWLL